MKSYTDLEQSKKLAEILPLESADMHYATWTILDGEFIVSPNQGSTIKDLQEDYGTQIIPCWSLAALVDVLPFHIIANNQRYAFGMVKGLNKDGETYSLRYNIYNTEIFLHQTDYYDNPIDACYEMIIKLDELNLL